MNTSTISYARATAGFIALLLFASPSRAESTNYQFTVQTDRTAALYQVGEVVRFQVAVQANGEPLPGVEIRWSTSKDGFPPERVGRLTLTNGSGVVPSHLDEPGFIQCKVWFQSPAGSNLTATAGAGVDPLKIKPSLPVPEDFDAFWSAQKKKLAAIPINPRLTSVKSPQAEVECFDLQADSVGAPVSGYFAKPVGAKPKSLPIMLTVHGAGVRSSGLGTAANWAKQGFLALDINAHGIANGKPAEFYRDLERGELSGYRQRGRESRETVYFLGMFLRLVRAIDFLTAQPEWDGRVLVVHGSSQGGAQAIVAAGLDSRVTFFAAGVAAMCDHSGAMANRISGWPKLVPLGEGDRPDAKILEAARYYDMVNFASRITVPGIMTVGFIDTTCPPTSVYAAYNALAGPKEMFNDTPSTHRVSPESDKAMKAAIHRHVAERKAAN
jgi:cephalosporin-C deacetylase-like acetyl esterase